MDQTGLRDKMLFCSLSVYLKAALFFPGHNVQLLSVSESGSCALWQEYENMMHMIASYLHTPLLHDNKGRDVG